jgi:dihydroflavonol-4-reductase
MGPILVTGATGFVGRHLAQALLAEGASVRALVELTSMGAEIVRVDLLDGATVRKALDGCQTVFHLAAQMLAPGVSRKRYFSINIDGTRNLAAGCARAGVQRLVFASSSGVYGVIRHPPADEDYAINPTSAYRESKWRAEQAVRDALQGTACEYVIARLSGLMGPGSMNWLGLSQAIARGRFRIIGRGQNHDNVAYITDVARGLILCGETAGVGGRVYLIGGKPSARIDHIINAIARELGVPTPDKHLPLWPYRVFNRIGEQFYRLTGLELPGIHRYALFLADKILDLSRAERELGYQPQVPLASGVQETIDWYRARQLIANVGAGSDTPE